MNILQIGTTNRGGAGGISVAIKNGAEASGHTTSLFVADKFGVDKNIFVIPRKTIRRYLSFLLSVEDLYDTDWIMDTKEFQDADIIHCHNLHGRFFNLKTLRKMSEQKPLVWTLHDEWAITSRCVCTCEGTEIKKGFYQCPQQNIPPRMLWNNEWYVQWRKKKIYERSKIQLVVPSNWLMLRVAKSVLKEKPVRCIYNGIDTTVYKRGDSVTSRKKLNLPLDKKIVLFLADGGKIVPWKGWEYTESVIECYKNRKDILFLCVGNPAPIAQELSQVQYIERIDDKNILALYYSAADVMIYTSLADNLPLIVLEALSCGLPIVSFWVGGVPEIVEHKKNGYIAEYKNTADICNGLDYMFNLSPIEKEEMSKISSEKISTQFSSQRMVSAYLELYKTLL